MDAATVDLIRNVTTGAVIVALQAWNSLKHEQTRGRVRELQATVAVDYADVRAELEAAMRAIESVMVKLNGKERRTTLTDAESARAAGSGFGQRWTDPKLPRPPDAPNAAG
jgi:hypothetical protein